MKKYFVFLPLIASCNGLNQSNNMMDGEGKSNQGLGLLHSFETDRSSQEDLEKHIKKQVMIGFTEGTIDLTFILNQKINFLVSWLKEHNIPLKKVEEVYERSSIDSIETLIALLLDDLRDFQLMEDYIKWAEKKGMKITPGDILCNNPRLLSHLNFMYKDCRHLPDAVHVAYKANPTYEQFKAYLDKLKSKEKAEFPHELMLIQSMQEAYIKIRSRKISDVINQLIPFIGWKLPKFRNELHAIAFWISDLPIPNVGFWLERQTSKWGSRKFRCPSDFTRALRGEDT